MPRYLVIIVVGITLLVGGYVVFLRGVDQTPRATAPDVVRYALVDTSGQAVDQTRFAGKHTLVFFGYTYCPDVCPTTLTDMATVLELLGNQAEKLVPIFITVDPERDDVKTMHDYMSNFDPAIVGLTGPVARVHAAAQAFRVYFKKEIADKDDPESYLVSHQALLYLMTPDGRGPIKVFKFNDKPEDIARALRDIL